MAHHVLSNLPKIPSGRISSGATWPASDRRLRKTAAASVSDATFGPLRRRHYPTFRDRSGASIRQTVARAADPCVVLFCPQKRQSFSPRAVRFFPPGFRTPASAETWLHAKASIGGRNSAQGWLMQLKKKKARESWPKQTASTAPVATAPPASACPVISSLSGAKSAPCSLTEPLPSGRPRSLNPALAGRATFSILPGRPSIIKQGPIPLQIPGGKRTPHAKNPSAPNTANQPLPFGRLAQHPDV